MNTAQILNGPNFKRNKNVYIKSYPYSSFSYSPPPPLPNQEKPSLSGCFFFLILQEVFEECIIMCTYFFLSFFLSCSLLFSFWQKRSKPITWLSPLLFSFNHIYRERHSSISLHTDLPHSYYSCLVLVFVCIIIYLTQPVLIMLGLFSIFCHFKHYYNEQTCKYIIFSQYKYLKFWRIFPKTLCKYYQLIFPLACYIFTPIWFVKNNVVVIVLSYCAWSWTSFYS